MAAYPNPISIGLGLGLRKSAGSLISYATTIKLDGMNYEIWPRSFISVTNHDKYILKKDEPIDNTGKYVSWDKKNVLPMSWMMNSVDSIIVATIAYYTTTKELWELLHYIFTIKILVIKAAPKH